MKRNNKPKISGMSKDKIVGQSRHNRGDHSHSLRRNWWIIGLVLLLSIGIFGAGFKYLESKNLFSKKEISPDPEQRKTTDDQPANYPAELNYSNSSNSSTNTTLQAAKDYVYSGTRLVAIEEPGVSMSPPADLAVWRKSTGVWYVMAGDGTIQAAAQWGVETDIPVPGDYDGDGKTDFAVFRRSGNSNPSTWYFLKSSDNSFNAFSFGTTTDEPVPADYDGDGQIEIAVWRPGDGIWHIIASSSQQYYSLQFGLTGDKPIPADYDGDGKADLAVWRPSDTTWYIWKSLTNDYQIEQFGSVSDKLVTGDYDGDGKYDLAVWQDNSQWKIKQSGSGSIRFVQFGIFSSDISVPGDYDGDGKTDVAIWRPSTGVWWIEQSAFNYQVRATQWGMNGDIPVPAPYRR